MTAKCTNPKRPYFVQINEIEREMTVSRPDCHNWSCEHCARGNATRWGEKIGYAIAVYIERGEKFWFITLTSHEKLKTRKDTERVFPLAWHKLYYRLKRTSTGKMVYISIPERHKDGRMHAHFIVNIKVTKKWLKDNARECGFGYQADVKEIEEYTQVIGYVVKYMRKSIGKNSWSRRFRRIRTSRGLPVSIEEKQTGKWVVIPAKSIVKEVYEKLTSGYVIDGQIEPILEKIAEIEGNRTSETI